MVLLNLVLTGHVCSTWKAKNTVFVTFPLYSDCAAGLLLENGWNLIINYFCFWVGYMAYLTECFTFWIVSELYTNERQGCALVISSPWNNELSRITISNPFKKLCQVQITGAHCSVSFLYCPHYRTPPCSETILVENMHVTLLNMYVIHDN